MEERLLVILCPYFVSPSPPFHLCSFFLFPIHRHFTAPSLHHALVSSSCPSITLNPSQSFPFYYFLSSLSPPFLNSFPFLDLTSLCFVFSSLPPINFCSLPLLLTPLLSVLLFSFLSFYFFLYILPLSFFFPIVSLLCIYSSFL